MGSGEIKALFSSTEGMGARRKKAGVSVSNCNLEIVPDGVLLPMLQSRFFNGVMNSFKMFLLVDDMGVLLGLTALSGLVNLADLHGVAWIVPTTFVSLMLRLSAGLVGVSSTFLNGRASNRPRTRPSRCGVGPIEVGTAGLNSFLLREGVTAFSPVWL